MRSQSSQLISAEFRFQWKSMYDFLYRGVLDTWIIWFADEFHQFHSLLALPFNQLTTVQSHGNHTCAVRRSRFQFFFLLFTQWFCNKIPNTHTHTPTKGNWNKFIEECSTVVNVFFLLRFHVETNSSKYSSFSGTQFCICSFVASPENSNHFDEIACVPNKSYET